MRDAVGDVRPRRSAVERAEDAAVERAGEDAVAVCGDALGAGSLQAERNPAVVDAGYGIAGCGKQPHPLQDSLSA